MPEQSNDYRVVVFGAGGKTDMSNLSFVFFCFKGNAHELLKLRKKSSTVPLSGLNSKNCPDWSCITEP